MKRLAAAGALALLTLPSSPAFADWPQFRGPEAPISIPAGPHRLEVAWKQALGSGYSNVSVAGGLAVTWRSRPPGGLGLSLVGNLLAVKALFPAVTPK